MLSKQKALLMLTLAVAVLSACTAPTPSDSAAPIPSETPNVASYGAAPDSRYATYGDYGVILGVTEEEGSVRIVAEGRYGYHMDEDPAIMVEVSVDQNGVISEISLLNMRGQTPGFGELVTDTYLKETYTGLSAQPTMEVDAASGASVSSAAALYAVQAAANYAQQVYGYVAEDHDEDNAEFSAVCPGEYTPVESGAEIDAQTVGSVLYAARGTTAEGKEVVAMKVQSSRKVAARGSADTGFAASFPQPFTMILVVDQGTSRIIAWQMVKDGTNHPEYFTVPDDKIDAYMSVPITDAEVFDDFTEGLVFDIPVERESGNGGYDVITGTSVVYSGATLNGTYSSQMVRLCFMTAARFYAGI